MLRHKSRESGFIFPKLGPSFGEKVNFPPKMSKINMKNKTLGGNDTLSQKNWA